MKTTNQKDKNGREIFVGDMLECDHGYMITVIEDNGDFYGKLLCEPNHSCADIPYALNPDISEVKEK